MVSLREFGKFRQTVWTTNDHRKIKICDMTNEHVINVIWHIKENIGGYTTALLQNFINEANFRDLEWSTKTNYKYPKKEYQPKYPKPDRKNISFDIEAGGPWSWTYMK